MKTDLWQVTKISMIKSVSQRINFLYIDHVYNLVHGITNKAKRHK